MTSAIANNRPCGLHTWFTPQAWLLECPTHQDDNFINYLNYPLKCEYNNLTHCIPFQIIQVCIFFAIVIFLDL